MQLYRIRILVQKYYLFQTLQSFLSIYFILDVLKVPYTNVSYIYIVKFGCFIDCQNESVKLFRYFLFDVLRGILSMMSYNFVFFRGFQ